MTWPLDIKIMFTSKVERGEADDKVDVGAIEDTADKASKS